MVIKKSYYKLQFLETGKHTENVLKDIFKRHVMASRSSHLVAVFCENHVTEISKGLIVQELVTDLFNP